MKRSQFWVGLALAFVLVSAARSVSAEDRLIGGVELGATGALSPMERYVKNGFTLSPFGGYMYNDFLGAVGNLHVIGIPNKDSSPTLLEDDMTWALGATVGPRFALPLGGLELWGTWQAGLYTGLAPHSAISDTSWGFSTGGGANLKLTEKFSLGAFAKYNRLYQRVHHQGDVRFATGGISLHFNLPKPAPPPPPQK